MNTDAKIQKDVLQELSYTPAVTHAHIGATVTDGIVTLYGTVPSYAEKSMAEAAAQRVSGVKAVVERLEVKLPSADQRSDENIAAAAAAALTWHIQVPNDRVKVTVDHGHVYLVGEVDWEFQRRAAIEAVKGLAGVTNVTSSIKLTPKVSPADVKEKIEQALNRAATREAKRIEVKVEGHKATLTGSVRSFKEMFDAQGAAFNAPGITEVVNHLDVL